jgi:hypothetical protein
MININKSSFPFFISIQDEFGTHLFDERYKDFPQIEKESFYKNGLSKYYTIEDKNLELYGTWE